MSTAVDRWPWHTRLYYRAWDALLAGLGAGGRNTSQVWYRLLRARLTENGGREDLHHDPAPWYAAATLSELGAVQADWMETAGADTDGDGYLEPETFEHGLRPVLAALNRAGLVTCVSQPGDAYRGLSGRVWYQRAAVCGYADDATLEWLGDVLAGTRFHLDAHQGAAGDARLPWRHRDDGVEVTVSQDGEVGTTFGHPSSRDGVAIDFYDCNPDMMRVLCEAWQVTVWDPEWEANDLWPLLHDAALSVTLGPAAMP